MLKLQIKKVIPENQSGKYQKLLFLSTFNANAENMHFLCCRVYLLKFKSVLNRHDLQTIFEILYEPLHATLILIAVASNKGSDYPAHTHCLARSFDARIRKV